MLALIEGQGVEAIDDYGLQGWYVLAREAAAAGKRDEAFHALRRASEYRCNGPLTFVNQWEKDTRWGELRQDPESQRILAERRWRIGPAYGQLHYFPGW